VLSVASDSDLARERVGTDAGDTLCMSLLLTGLALLPWNVIRVMPKEILSKGIFPKETPQHQRSQEDGSLNVCSIENLILGFQHPIQGEAEIPVVYFAVRAARSLSRIFSARFRPEESII